MRRVCLNCQRHFESKKAAEYCSGRCRAEASWRRKAEAQAKKAGISREYVARLEGGRQDPTLSTLQKLAKALKVKVGKLLE